MKRAIMKNDTMRKEHSEKGKLIKGNLGKEASEK